MLHQCSQARPDPNALQCSKAPYGAPTQIDGQQITHYIDSKVTAIRRINQGLHRGLRTQDAVCRLLLLDPRFNRPELIAAIPERFRTSMRTFDVGQRKEILSDELKRNTALKLAALKRDQYRCQWVGCTVDQRHMLEVHHIRPLNEGERPSKLADVITYCANHHREAHYLMRQAN